MNDQRPIDDYAAVNTAGDTLVIQRWLPGPLSRVWSFLTDSDRRAQWLAAGDMELRPGAPLQLVWRNDQLCQPGDARPEGFAEEQRMASQIVAVEPMTRLAFAWGAGVVDIALREREGRVLLTLTHSGLDAGSRLGISAGWHTHLDILRACLEGTGAPSFWATWARLRSDYAAR